jgi:hypothetical protein
VLAAADDAIHRSDSATNGTVVVPAAEHSKHHPLESTAISPQNQLAFTWYHGC